MVKNEDDKEYSIHPGEGGFASAQDYREALPEFLREENLRDIQGKRPGENGYDETSIHIPSGYWQMFTPAMKQYWQIKQTNAEKILFFKLGKFYEIFYHDAIICHQILDLNWMGSKKLHVGFPEKSLDKYLCTMVNRGYKVAVIEQTETPKQLKERQETQAKDGKSMIDKCVKREISEMVTRGTFIDKENLNYEPKFILAYRKEHDRIGVTFFDVTTLKIFIGSFTDDKNLSIFRTLICQIRPVEIIQEREVLQNSHVVKMLKNSPGNPTFTNLQPNRCYGFIKTCSKLESLLGQVSEWPPVLRSIKEHQDEVAFQSVGMALAFLEDTLIAERTIQPGTFI